jgi:hypothetical protein
LSGSGPPALSGLLSSPAERNLPDIILLEAKPSKGSRYLAPGSEKPCLKYPKLIIIKVHA